MTGQVAIAIVGMRPYRYFLAIIGKGNIPAEIIFRRFSINVAAHLLPYTSTLFIHPHMSGVIAGAVIETTPSRYALSIGRHGNVTTEIIIRSLSVDVAAHLRPDATVFRIHTHMT